MQNANFTESWTDVDLQSGGFNLQLVRSYNSRTLFNGMFGFGWCTNYETYLTIMPDKRLKRVECGSAVEITYSPKSFSMTDVDDAVTKIVQAVKHGNPKSSDADLKKLKDELKNNPDRRESEAKIYNIKSDIKAGTTFFSEQESTDKVILKKDYYERLLSDGTIQKFDLQGHLINLTDPKGNFINIDFHADHIYTITTNTGNKISFGYNAHNKVESVKGPKGVELSYQYEKVNDLIYVKNATGQANKYAYDNLHNMTSIQYPDGGKKTLRYNQDKDWVIGLTDREGCEEKYDYVASKNDPQNNYTSSVIKKCDGKVMNQSKYEFWFKNRTTVSGGGKYLARLVTDINGSKTDITYHDLFARPISLTKDGKTTTYTYHSNSFLKSQKSGDHLVTYDYDWRFNKVSEITDGKNKTKFEYDKEGNLTLARNTAGQIVKLVYDTKGRIIGINDQARRLIKIEYDERFNKPKIVERPGVGTIIVSYKNTGEIDSVKSKDGNPTVAVQVASAFNNLLEIIAPAGISVGI